MTDNMEHEHQSVQTSSPATDNDWDDDYESEDGKLKGLQHRVRSNYEDGKPLFTKEIIRAAIEDRDRCLSDQSRVHEFYMTGYHDKPVRVTVPPQRYHPSEGMRVLRSGPFIHYCSIESMLSDEFAWEYQLALSVVIRTGSTWYTMEADDQAEVLEWTSPDALTNHFLRVQHQWQVTEVYAAFKQVLLSARFPMNINKIIGYALGSYFIHGRVSGNRSLLQHAIILLLRDVLSFQSGRGEVKCLLQEPTYCLQEKETNAALGMTVVEDPDGFLLVDDESVVVSIAPNVPVKQIVLDLCRPAAIIWVVTAPMSEAMSKRFPMTDPESTRVQAIMREHYDAFQLPDSDAAADLVLYVRKS